MMPYGFARHFREFALVGAVVLGTSAARAAELPNRAAKKTVDQKMQTCDIDGQPGFRLQGGDTCMRVSGYVSAGVSSSLSKTH